MTRGLPGAGKTTRALRWLAEDPEHRARVGSDEIALMLHPDVLGGDAYSPLFAEREQLLVSTAIETLLRSGIDVVCDDPFLLTEYLDAARELAIRCDAELIIWDMTDVDVELCIARDAQRGRAGGRCVGEREIRIQHQLLLDQSPLIVADAVGAGAGVSDASLGISSLEVSLSGDRLRLQP